MVDKVYELGAEDFEIPRNTFEENVNFILSDLDRAADLLGGQSFIAERASAATLAVIPSPPVNL